MAGKTLKVGDMAPDFELPGDSGRMVKLSDFRGKRVILYFYPKDGTSGCTKQACGFRDAYPVIEEQNAVVIGISPDGINSHQKFKTKYDLPFVLLSDESHAVADAYAVWGQKAMWGRKYLGVIRSHFVIDASGKLADVQVKVRPAESVKRALQSINE
ncbi:MAG: thioredoxin-dependent thiol peroxidase [Anaerolineae bacterium]